MAPEPRLRLSLCLAIALALPPAVLAQRIPRGGELQVNTYTTGYQGIPAVGMDADGDFVVVWKSTQDGGGFGVFARLFTQVGAPLATELQVNTYTAGYQGFPALAVRADGDFVVAWESEQDGSGKGVFARRFSSAGVPLDGEFQVNTYTSLNQYREQVAMDGDGGFVVTWESFQDGHLKGVFAQRFASAGDRVGGEFQVNTYTIDHQRLASVAASASGDFVVAWQGYNGQDGSGSGIFAQRFSSAGSVQGGELQVNAHTVGTQRYPSVTADAEGDFIVTWYSYAQDGSSYGVFARRFSSAGEGLALEFQVATYTLGYQGVPSVKAAAGGDFVVAWASSDGSDNGVFVRAFSSSGTALGTELRVNTYTDQTQRLPSVAVDAEGDFVVTWQSNGQDGSDQGVFAQRFGGPITLDVDGNGSTDPLTDGLLVLRYLFGFTGATLTNAAVDLDGCSRCDADAIEPYLDQLGIILDIDGNEVNDALTDGLLVLRSLFGFTGNTLISGAVELGGCSRCNAAVLEPHLALLTE